MLFSKGVTGYSTREMLRSFCPVAGSVTSHAAVLTLGRLSTKEAHAELQEVGARAGKTKTLLCVGRWPGRSSTLSMTYSEVLPLKLISAVNNSKVNLKTPVIAKPSLLLSAT